MQLPISVCMLTCTFVNTLVNIHFFSSGSYELLCFTVYLVWVRYVNMCLLCIASVTSLLHFVPEKPLASLTGHGVKVEPGGFVPAHAADTRHVPVKLLSGQRGCTHNRGLHH